MTITPTKALTHAAASEDAFLKQLFEFLSIPSVSTESKHHADVLRAAEWLAENLRSLGLENVEVIPTAGNPVVYGDWLKAAPEAPTVLVYGHYDVQPVDPIELWNTPPFEPTIVDGKVYARGASDNKAQHFIHAKAFECILAADGKLPVNVKVCFDGEEEVGSPNLAPFILAHQEKLACDVVLVSDGAMVNEMQPSIEYGLRGIVGFDLVVTGPARDLHSGSYGGSVHNPAQALAAMLAQFHDENGTVQIPGFYDGIPELSDEERSILAEAPYDEAAWQKDTGAPKPWGEKAYSIKERFLVRPTCEINGITSGWGGEGSKTIIPAKAGTKITMRMVEGQDPERIAELFKAFIADITPDTVRSEVTFQHGAKAAVTPYNSREIEAAKRAYADGWGVEPKLYRAGGSLPIVNTFQSALGAPFVLMPFGLDDNRHSPNEHFILDYFGRGLRTAIHFYYNLAG